MTIFLIPYQTIQATRTSVHANLVSIAKSWPASGLHWPLWGGHV